MAFKVAAVLAAIAVAAAAFAVASVQGKLVVTGVVPCNAGTLIDVATSPAFPGTDAKVELRCGVGVVAGATTSQNGSFAMEADVTSAVVAALVGACELVVGTPLAKCDARLPAAGRLVPYVQQGPLARLTDRLIQQVALYV